MRSFVAGFSIKLLLKQFANYFILVLLFAGILAYGQFCQEKDRLTAFFILGIALQRP
jgi:hypothetical protein